MDPRPRGLTAHRRLSYRRTSAHFRRKREVWCCRMAERMADRILARTYQEEVLVEGGSSGCIRTRQHRAAVGKHREGTGSEHGRRWPDWMGPGAVCSSRR